MASQLVRHELPFGDAAVHHDWEDCPTCTQLREAQEELKDLRFYKRWATSPQTAAMIGRMVDEYQRMKQDKRQAERDARAMGALAETRLRMGLWALGALKIVTQEGVRLFTTSRVGEIDAIYMTRNQTERTPAEKGAPSV